MTHTPSRSFSAISILFAAMFVAICANSARADAIDLKTAAGYFNEAKRLSDADDGRLWGKSLYGPLMFVDPASKFVVANQQDADGKLEASDGVFVGKLPDDETFGNTAKPWSGTHWTMVLWPLPKDERARGELMTHELWHRIQSDLGLPARGEGAGHLDERDGRIWMQLEWKALLSALTAQDDARTRAIHDALVFRAYRRSLFKNAAQSENALELNEGLAEYTGTMMAHPEKKRRTISAIAKLSMSPQKPSFVRSFAYASGPAYGLLLNEVSAGWNRKVTLGDDLGELLAAEKKILLPADLKAAAQESAKRYGGDAVFAAEDARDRERQARIAEYRKRYTNGPTLTLDLQSMNIMFDPNRVMPLDDAGNIYEGARIVDAWGTLDAPGGLLMASNWKRATVPAPTKRDGGAAIGEGYTLTLKPGWHIEPTGKDGCCCVKKD